jgi:hypothetical protein
MNTVQEIKSEILTAIANGEELDNIRDNSGEWVDGYLPVYNNQIIAEWQAMPSEYDDRGSHELGQLGDDITVINLMSLDLYLYYSDLFQEALAIVEQELEKEGEE